MSDDLGSRKSVRSLRDIARVNYRSLHQGESQLSDMADRDVIGILEVRLLRIILIKVMIKSRVKHSSERSRLSASPEISVEHEMDMDTIEQLRSDSKLRHTVQKQLAEHGLLSAMHSTSSDSDSSSYYLTFCLL